MITFMFISLSILPICALVSGALFLRVKNQPLHVPSFLLFGFLTMYVDFHYYYRAYEVTFSKEQWGPAATTMGMFSIVTTLNAVCFGLLGAGIYSLFSRLTKKQDAYAKLSTTKIAAVLILAMSTATFQIMNHHSQSASQKIIAKASGDLTPELVSELLQINQNIKDKTMITTLLMNPNCPEAVLNEYSQKDAVLYRASVLKNPNVTQEIVTKLATDENEVVRYHVVINKKVTNELLAQLSQDPAKDVRKKAQAMLENRTEKK